jgi:hypothetical protein
LNFTYQVLYRTVHPETYVPLRYVPGTVHCAVRVTTVLYQVSFMTTVNVTVGSCYIPTHDVITSVPGIRYSTATYTSGYCTRRQIMKKMRVREKCKTHQSHTSEFDLLRRTTTPLPRHPFLWFRHQSLAFSISLTGATIEGVLQCRQDFPRY